MRKKLAIIFLIVMVVIFSMPTYKAARADDSGFWIGGTRITDSIGTTVIPGDEGKAIYDGATNTITLDNYKCEGLEHSRNGYMAVIYGEYLDRTLTIEIKGRNVLRAGGHGVTQGIMINAPLIIKGDGILSVMGSDGEFYSSTGISTGNSSFTMQGGTVLARGGDTTYNPYSSIQSNGVRCGELIVSGGTLTAIAGHAGGSVGIITNTYKFQGVGSFRAIGKNCAIDLGNTSTVIYNLYLPGRGWDNEDGIGDGAILPGVISMKDIEKYKRIEYNNPEEFPIETTSSTTTTYKGEQKPNIETSTNNSGFINEKGNKSKESNVSKSPELVKAKILKISKRKKSAKKIKITLKRVECASGYQIAVFDSKKNAKKNIKALINRFTSKVKYTLKSTKIKNKKILYLKARAYRIKDEKLVFGKWSKIKKTKCK